MTCNHLSIKEARTGQQANCISCGIDIMFDGERWTWTFGIAKAKREKYATIFRFETAALAAHS